MGVTLNPLPLRSNTERETAAVWELVNWLGHWPNDLGLKRSSVIRSVRMGWGRFGRFKISRRLFERAKKWEPRGLGLGT